MKLNKNWEWKEIMMKKETVIAVLRRYKQKYFGDKKSKFYSKEKNISRIAIMIREITFYVYKKRRRTET